MTSSDPVDVRRRAGSLSAEQDDLESWLAGHRERVAVKGEQVSCIRCLPSSLPGRANTSL